MRIVCDTNVLVSGILFGGAAREIIRLASQGRLTSFLSPAMLDELQEVLARPKFGLSPDQVLAVVALLRESSDLVTPSIQIAAVAADPDDNRILEAAAAAQAEVLISGDAHLLDLRQWQGIDILTAAQFLARLAG